MSLGGTSYFEASQDQSAGYMQFQTCVTATRMVPFEEFNPSDQYVPESHYDTVQATSCEQAKALALDRFLGLYPVMVWEDFIFNAVASPLWEEGFSLRK